MHISETEEQELRKVILTKLPHLNPDKLLLIPGEVERILGHNIEEGIKDILGLSVASGSRFYKDLKKLKESFSLPDLFNGSPLIRVDFYDKSDTVSSQLCKKLEKVTLFELISSIFPDDRSVYVGIDCATSGDVFGVAVGFCENIEEIPIGDTFRKAGMYKVPLIFGLDRASGAETPIRKVEDFIREINFIRPVAKVIFDKHQSKQLTQDLSIDSQGKIGVQYMSIEQETPHKDFKNDLYDGRIQLPDSRYLYEEAIGLTAQDGYVDHRRDTTSDLWQAMMRCVLGMREDGLDACQTQEMRQDDVNLQAWQTWNKVEDQVENPYVIPGTERGFF